MVWILQHESFPGIEVENKVSQTTSSTENYEVLNKKWTSITKQLLGEILCYDTFVKSWPRVFKDNVE